MSDLVKAEAQAVGEIKRGLLQYADRLRRLVADVRQQARGAEQATGEAVAERRSQLRKCESEALVLRETLARSPDERRGEMVQAVRAAEQEVAAAKKALENARQAERTISAALGDLTKVAASVETIVSEGSLAAVSTLTSLEEKLVEITSRRGAAFARNAITTIGIAAEVATTVVGGAQLAGNVSQGAIPTAETLTTTSQLQEWRTERDQEQWAQTELDQKTRSAGTLRSSKRKDEE